MQKKLYTCFEASWASDAPVPVVLRGRGRGVSNGLKRGRIGGPALLLTRLSSRLNWESMKDFKWSNKVTRKMVVRWQIGKDLSRRVGAGERLLVALTPGQDVWKEMASQTIRCIFLDGKLGWRNHTRRRPTAFWSLNNNAINSFFSLQSQQWIVPAGIPLLSKERT